MIKQALIILVFLTLAFSLKAQQAKAPDYALGSFTDDYGIKYTINDSLWIQHPGTKYHVLRWNTEKQYLIVKNDKANVADTNLYTRIDYMTFADMQPWEWGFCLTVYKAETDEIAEKTASADRQNPKAGCNGYPFSRMKKVEDKP